MQVNSQSTMVKSIALFNHKGGVGKTTTAFSLGWALAEAGHKVLLVDLDSQCSLTGWILGGEILDHGLDEFYESRANLTIKSVVRQIMDSVSVEDILRHETGRLYPTRQANLYLMPGSLTIADLDPQISIALKAADGIPVLKRVPGALPGFIRRFTERERFDFVVFDLSPSVGGLNEIMLMSSDYFIVPTSPDYFCMQAVTSLAARFDDWHREIDAFKKAAKTALTFALTNCPQCLGAILQNGRSSAYSRWNHEICKAFAGKLLPKLKEIDCNVAVDGEAASHEACVFVHLPESHTLMDISWQLSKPPSALTDQDLSAACRLDGILHLLKNDRDAYREAFKRLIGVLGTNITQ